MATTRRILYLVRHAIAEERGKAWPDDSKRPLTKAGKARFREVVKGLRRLEVDIDLIVTSPLVRAKQTAQILARGLRPRPPLKTSAALAPEQSPAKAAASLRDYRKARQIALVGHEPGLGNWPPGSMGPTRRSRSKRGHLPPRGARGTRRRIGAADLVRHAAPAAQTLNSDDGARLHDAALRHDDDAAADVVPVAVDVLDAALVDEPDALPDPRVLVDDHPVEDGVAADAQRRLVERLLVEVRAEQHRSRYRRAAMDVLAHADDAVGHVARVEERALADERVLHLAVV